MKRILFLLLTLTALTVACHHHDDDHEEDLLYNVVIDIAQPVEFSEFAAGIDIPVRVEFTHLEDKTIHNVKIWIADAAGASLQVLEERHVHMVGTYTFNLATAFNTPTAGNYKVKVSTTNDDGEAEKTAERNFSVK